MNVFQYFVPPLFLLLPPVLYSGGKSCENWARCWYMQVWGGRGEDISHLVCFCVVENMLYFKMGGRGQDISHLVCFCVVEKMLYFKMVISRSFHLKPKNN